MCDQNPTTSPEITKEPKRIHHIRSSHHEDGRAWLKKAYNFTIPIQLDDLVKEAFGAFLKIQILMLSLPGT